jgi:hypothetical protein
MSQSATNARNHDVIATARISPHMLVSISPFPLPPLLQTCRAQISSPNSRQVMYFSLPSPRYRMQYHIYQHRASIYSRPSPIPSHQPTPQLNRHPTKPSPRPQNSTPLPLLHHNNKPMVRPLRRIPNLWNKNPLMCTRRATAILRHHRAFRHAREQDYCRQPDICGRDVSC